MSLEATTQKVNDLAAKSGGFGNTIKFATDEGIIYLDGTGEANTVSNEEKDADCVVRISHGDLNDMLSGDLNPMTAFMSGKIKIDGDMGVAMKLQSLFA